MTPQPVTDSQIRAAFVARSIGSPSPELADQIASATRRVRQQSRLTLLPGGLGNNTQRLLWAAVISASSLALVGGLLLAGSQNDNQISVLPTETPSTTPPPPSTDPSASPEPSLSPEPTPSVAPSPSPSPVPSLAVDVPAVTLVGDLRVRSLPTVGASSERLEPLLPANARILIIEGPVAADGYNWYHVLPYDSTYPSGWVAGASRELEPWIAEDETACPELPLDATELAALVPYGGLACFGNQEIQLTGELECELADVDHTVGGPSWLHHDRYCTMDLGTSTMAINDGGMPVEYGPGRSNGVVTGHFADPESSTCEVAIEDVDPPPDPAEIIAGCRAMFVGTDWLSVPID